LGLVVGPVAGGFLMKSGSQAMVISIIVLVALDAGARIALLLQTMRLSPDEKSGLPISNDPGTTEPTGLVPRGLMTLIFGNLQLWLTLVLTFALWSTFYSLCAALPWHLHSSFQYTAMDTSCVIAGLYFSSVLAAPLVGWSRTLHARPFIGVAISVTLLATALAALLVSSCMSFSSMLIIDHVSVITAGLALGVFVPSAKMVLTKTHSEGEKWQYHLFACYFVAQGMAMAVGHLLGDCLPVSQLHAWRLLTIGLMCILVISSIAAIGCTVRAGWPTSADVKDSSSYDASDAHSGLLE